MTPATSFLPARPKTYLPEGLLIVTQTYGSDAFSYDFKAALAAANAAPDRRDPNVSYGIPPRLAERFQRTGRGPMFEPPSRVKRAPIETASAPTLERFVKHAERFGTELVFETAQAHLSEDELRTLDAELSRFDTKRKRLFPDDAKSELDTEILRISETLPVAQVAHQVGKSKSYVYSVLRTASETGSNPSMSMEEVA